MIALEHRFVLQIQDSDELSGSRLLLFSIPSFIQALPFFPPLGLQRRKERQGNLMHRRCTSKGALPIAATCVYSRLDHVERASNLKKYVLFRFQNTEIRDTSRENLKRSVFKVIWWRILQKHCIVAIPLSRNLMRPERTPYFLSQ